MASAKVRFFSHELGMCVTCNVILPQRADGAAGRRVPVLWLLHGAYGDYSDWVRQTGIERYASAYGLAVVMPSAQNSCYLNMAHGQNFEAFIVKELPEALPKMFNLSARREDNFIAGLSMGGEGSLRLGLLNPEKYSAIGCFSAGGVDAPGSYFPLRRQEILLGGPAEEHPEMRPIAAVPRILAEGLPCPRIFHTCGTEDELLPAARATRDYFEALPGKPFDYQYTEGPGSHDWDFWDGAIRQFLEFLNLPKNSGEFI